MNRDELMAALNRAMREVSGQGVLYSQTVAERLGVGGADLECLDFIFTRGAVTAGELARLTGLTTGAITGVIDRLEGSGLLQRRADGGDRRVHRLFLTAPGRALQAPLDAAMDQLNAEVAAELADAAPALWDGLRRLGDIRK